MAVERILGKTLDYDRFDSRREAVVALQREFVSFLQDVLDPRSFNIRVAKLVKESTDNWKPEKTIKALEGRNLDVYSGVEILMEIAASREK